MTITNNGEKYNEEYAEEYGFDMDPNEIEAEEPLFDEEPPDFDCDAPDWEDAPDIDIEKRLEEKPDRERVGQTLKTTSMPAGQIMIKRGYDELDKFRSRHEKHGKPFPTGFTGLDQSLNGGIRGLTILGGLSAAGKTAFAEQIADYTAQTRPVLFFPLEMSPAVLLCRSLSRIALENEWSKAEEGGSYKNFAEPMEQYTATEIMTALKFPPEELIKKYKNGVAGNLYFIENAKTVFDIRSVVTAFIAQSKALPLVVVDYLQILEAADPRNTDRRWNIDLNVKELSTLASDTGCCVLAISALNRENYKEKISTAALIESGGIEYGADVILGLQFRKTGAKGFDFEGEMKKTPRCLECIVLKSRMTESYVKSSINFYPANSFFLEPEADE